MNKLINLIRERRRRQEDRDPILAIFRIFIDPGTKMEATDLPRQASVIGGPRLQQETNESDEVFETRVMSLAHQLREQNEQTAWTAL